MTETRHTPGPWVFMTDDLCYGEIRDCGTFTEIARMPELDDRPGDFALIAAAPEFWTACVLGEGFSTDGATLLEQAAYELRQHGPHLHALAGELERKAKLERAAIAKARGEVT